MVAPKSFVMVTPVMANNAFGAELADAVSPKNPLLVLIAKLIRNGFYALTTNALRCVA